MYRKTDIVDFHCKFRRSIKRQASKVFDDLGTNMSDAVRMFLVQVAIQKAIPFEIRIPNQTTIDALEEAERKHASLKSYPSVQEMFKDLD